MTQITTGIRSVLSHPMVYSALQTLMGAHAVRSALIGAVRPKPGMDILDIGCGPADILEYLPNTNYWGFDISAPYIEQARSRFGNRGNFQCKVLTNSDLQQLPKIDVVLAIGVLHHLDDDTAHSLLELAHRALKGGGRLITLDPCFEVGQHPIARFLISRDRGQNVRNKDEYAQLASGVFTDCRVEVRHKTGIPYTHCIMECTRT